MSARRIQTREAGFTLVELLTVIAIIIILAGLILSTAGYVQRKGAAARASAEIAALSSACENYKADNGIYPRAPQSTPGIPSTSVTDALDAKTAPDPSTYTAASLYLYKELSGDKSPVDRAVDAGQKSYFEFKPTMLSGTSPAVTGIIDPFGNSYGYSTAYAGDLDATPVVNPPTHGYNPTFDLWSTTGSKTLPDNVKWIKNW